MEPDIKLVVSNRSVLLRGRRADGKQYLAALDRRTSYSVAGHRFSGAFTDGTWDGRDHLLKYRRREGAYRLPIGLLGEAVAAARSMGIEPEIDESARTAPPPASYGWDEAFTLREYQERALAQALTAGSGILKLACGAGKTMLAGRLVWALKTPCLFTVTSQLLLRQAENALSVCLKRPAGVCGIGEWRPDHDGVTVATLQTLVARRETPEYRRLVGGVGLLIADEVHASARGEKFRQVLDDCNARYRFGLSATVFLSHESEVEKGIIYLQAACGPVVADIGASELVESGWLQRPTFRILRATQFDGQFSERWSPDLAERAICRNDLRNDMIARQALDLSRDGLRVLIVAHLRQHVDELVRRCRALGLDARPVTGREGMAQRGKDIAALARGEAQVLVGSVLGEGVNMPTLEAVIVAEGGKDPKASMQRLRNLRTSPGKTRCVVVDFADLFHPTYAAHSKARLAAYRDESAFRFEVVDA
jgi:superfamily II DNA or RNA helicase